jgi:hypothetical protein
MLCRASRTRFRAHVASDSAHFRTRSLGMRSWARALHAGFAVTGAAREEGLLRKGGLKPGQALILTKPLGSGVILAADMRGKAKGRWVAGNAHPPF